MAGTSNVPAIKLKDDLNNLGLEDGQEGENDETIVEGGNADNGDETGSVGGIKEGGGQEALSPFLSSNDPVLLSELLKLSIPLNKNIQSLYKNRAMEVARSKKQSAKDKRWISDYVIYADELAEEVKKAESVSAKALHTAAYNSQVSEVDVREKVTISSPKPTRQVIELNKLVKKPESFDGYKPPARRWLDDFERCSEANGWSEDSMVKFFSTFLDKAVNDWFVTIAKRKLGTNPSWLDLRSAFIRHYLGDSDKQTFREQLEKTQQGDKEKSTNFIPRVIRLVDLIEPNKPEEDLVDLIRSKLKQCYIDKLILVNTYTIEELNDACLKIEAAMDNQTRFNKPRFNAKDKKPNPRFNRYNKDDKDKPSSSQAPQSNDRDNRKFKCYRCEKLGHLASECKSATKADGSPCNKRQPKEKRAINCVAESDKSPSDQPKVVRQVRAAGATSISTIQVSNVNHPLSSLITHPIICNTVQLQALIDTGFQ